MIFLLQDECIRIGKENSFTNTDLFTGIEAS